MANALPPDASVYCPRDGSKWFVCESGSKFVGCCKLNPCERGCEAESLGAALMDVQAHGNVMDGFCLGDTKFYSCVDNTTKADVIKSFWGCCKINPCHTSALSCPSQYLRAAYRDSQNQFSQYSKIEVPLPNTRTGNATADDLPAAVTTTSKNCETGRANAEIMIGLCIAVIVALPVLVVMWICYRQLAAQPKKRFQSTERFAMIEVLGLRHCY